MQTIITLPASPVSANIASNRACACLTISSATSATRSAALPELPLIGDTGHPGANVIPWFGLFAPARTPADIVALLNRETNAVLKMPEVVEKFTALGIVITGGSTEQAQARVPAEMDKWAGVIQRGKLQFN